VGKTDPRPAPLRKTLLIGLDGATWDVIDPLLARGELPHLAALARRGVRARLRSTLPPITAAAWPSIITGLNPGRHGIYRFEVLDHGADATQDARPVSSDTIAGRTLFDYLGQQGARVLGVGIPMCYPVWPVNGRLLAGYPNPDPKRFFAYPPEWAEELERDLKRRGVADRDEVQRPDPRQRLARAEGRLTQVAAYVTDLLRREQFDFTMLVASVTDEFQHRYWHLRRGGARPDDPIDGVYRLADRVIGQLLEAADEDWIVGVVSDHGGGARPERLFVVNAWLRDQGFLAESRTARAGLKRRLARLLRRGARLPIKALFWKLLPREARAGLRKMDATAAQPDWSRTRASFVKLQHPVGGINVNLRGRQPQGIVEPGAEYEQVREAIIAALRQVTDPHSGARVVEQVWKREEVYAGPHLASAPDIVFKTVEQYAPQGGLGLAWQDAETVLHSEITGEHRMDGVLLLAGNGVFRRGSVIEGAQVADVAPTLLYAMGAPVPADVDGRVLEEAFELGFLAEHPLLRGAALGDATRARSEYSEEEEEGIKAALRGLGYIE